MDNQALPGAAGSGEHRVFSNFFSDHNIIQNVAIVQPKNLLISAIRDIFGGRSAASQKILRDSRQTCLRELKIEAYELGADAVIGVDLDYQEFSGKGKGMLFLVASGTAVKLRD